MFCRSCTPPDVIFGRIDIFPHTSKEAKQACKAAVGKCKTAEAAAAEGIDTCKDQCAATTPLITASVKKTKKNLKTAGNLKHFDANRSIL